MNGISVVIPTHGQIALVQQLLDSLVEATRQLGAQSEIIVVDDTPLSGAQQIQQSCARVGGRYIRGPRRVGAKRNVGAASAQYDVVLFIDSDCEATPSLLREHLNAYRQADDRLGGVAGPTEMKGPAPSFTWRVLDRSIIYNGPFTYPRRYARLLWAATSNISFRRTVFLAVGGFDEDTLTLVGGEDVDIGIRINEAGYYILALPNALVLHTRSTVNSLLPAARKLFMYGRAEVYLGTKHPRRVRWRKPRVPTVTGLLLLPSLAAARSYPRLLLVPLAIGGGGLLKAAAQRSRGKEQFWVEFAYHIVTVAIEWVFYTGVLFEALRQRRFRWLASSFQYLESALSNSDT